jgi:hypothetical protein
MESQERLRQQWDDIHGRRWIPVSERLPDEETFVLICYHDVENAQDAICLGYVFENSTWHDDDGIEINSPDYWMPLPNPPAT